MARSMPRFDLQFHAKASKAIELARSGELSTKRVNGENLWPVSKLESLYELAYLRIFIEWEQVMEDLLLRSMCGYKSSIGQETMVAGYSHFSTISLARAEVYGSHSYKLWHNPDIVVQRCQRFIETHSPSNPVGNGLQATIISSHQSRLKQFAAIRHRIAHGQEDAKQKFNNASLSLAGRTFRGAMAGKLLRYKNPNSIVNSTFLKTISDELTGLISQMI